MANGIIRTNPIRRYTLWDMRTDADLPDASLGAEFWDEAVGVNGNATGAGFNVTITGATGSANTTANATGAGFSITITGATGTASAATNGNATGAGFNVTITGATGSANTTANAAGAGFNVTITGATGTATGTSGAVNGNATGAGCEITVKGANGTAQGDGQANTLGGIIQTGNYYYRQRSEPLRVKKTKQKRQLAKDETQAQTEPKNPQNYNKEAVSAVKDARKRLFDAESAVKQAEDDLNLANLRLISYLEAAEMEIQAEDAEIMRIIAELL